MADLYLYYGRIMKIYSLPEEVCIDGVLYAVNTDFRVWIEIEELLSSSEINVFEKIQKVLCLCYKDALPETLDKAIDGVMQFYRCGKENVKSGSEKSSMPILNFSEDADMIGAAFYHDYGIDLWRTDMHWWQFYALFMSLEENDRIMQVMRYRAVDLHSVENKEQRKFYRKMKELYRLKDNRTPDERERDMIEKLNCVF